jgi:hypothetical protein
MPLRARPEATIELKGQHRLVSAREASGDERTRLWAKVGEYKGWGDNIDAFAELRAGQTAVVVFEPR